MRRQYIINIIVLIGILFTLKITYQFIVESFNFFQREVNISIFSVIKNPSSDDITLIISFPTIVVFMGLIYNFSGLIVSTIKQKKS